MSRNGSGTYTVPNTFSPGEVISSADHNENFDDLGDEITNSVAVDGQSTMTGTLKLSNGTAALPALTFGTDTDCGIYRIGGNNVGIAVNGAKVLDIATTGLGVTGALLPSSSDGGALGSTSLMWSDLFLASGSVINFNAGDVTITHAANGLTFAGGSSGYAFDAAISITAGGLSVSAGSVSLPAGSVAVAALNTALFATQAQQEAGTSNVVATTPGRQHNHPSAAKAWGTVIVSGGSPSLTANYNVTSITDNGVGDFTANLTTAMSSTNYAVIATVFNSGGGGFVDGVEVISQTASAIRFHVFAADETANTNQELIDRSFYFVVFGDQ